MSKIAIFPGSFDPITKGHELVVNRALPLFDQIIIAVGSNSQKKNLFPVEKRIQWIKDTFAGESKVSVRTYSGLTVDFAESTGASFILRGLRTSADFEFERAIAQMNKAMKPGIETIFLLTTPELSAITSTIVRDIINNGGDASAFVPEKVKLKN